eukprot:Colp12_sorted_trinity150504_noHs@9021
MASTVFVQPQGGAVAMQPVKGPNGIVYMPLPALPVPANCPPGLEYLLGVDHIFVHQLIELLEAFTGFETNSKFQIKNREGQQVFFAAEDTDCCTRQCCGSARPFVINVLGNNMQPVMRAKRGFRFSSPYCPFILPLNFCFLQKMEVEAPVGNLLGTIEQEYTLWGHHFLIKLASGETVLKLKAPCCVCDCFNNTIDVTTADGSRVIGSIRKKWNGIVQEVFTNADSFGVNFPMDLDVRAKAMLVAAVFLIDFMFFEDNANNNHN